MKTLIFGNGMNIQFDRDKEKYSFFVQYVDGEFRKILSTLDSGERMSSFVLDAFSVVKPLIEKINFKSATIDDYFGCLEITDMPQEMIDKLYNLAIPLLSKKPDSGTDFDKMASRILIANNSLTTLQSIFVKAVQNVLYDHFKIGELNIPDEIYKQIEGEYDVFITTNYDDNFPFPHLIKLHGAFNKYITDEDTFNSLFSRKAIDGFLEGTTLTETEIMNWGKWYELNAEGNSRIIFSGKSFEKRNYDSVKEDPDKWALIQHLAGQYKDIDLDKFSLESEYIKLENISGDVDVVGLSKNNDEYIFSRLETNPYISLINNYEGRHEEFWNKYKTIK